MAGVRKRLGSFLGPKGLKGDGVKNLRRVGDTLFVDEVARDADGETTTTTNLGDVRGRQGDQGLPGLDAVPQSEGLAAHVRQEGLVREAVDTRVAATTKLIPLTAYLAPGEAMPNDGIADAAALINTAVNDLLAKAAGPQPFGPIRYVLELGPGLFRLTSEIRPTGTTTKRLFGVRGAGANQTFLLPEGAMSGFQFDTPADLSAPAVAQATFEDFTIDLKAATLGPNGESRKGFVGRGFEDCWFSRVEVNNSPATAFGCDFPIRTTFSACGVNRTGLGADGPHPLPNGLIDAAKYHSGFGIGFGVFPDESVLFDGCWAMDCYRAGFFFELFEATTGSTYRTASIRMNACRSTLNRVGITNVGGSGVTAVNCQVTDNLLAGYLGGLTAVTNGLASIKTTLDACDLSRNGIGIYVTGDASDAPHNYIYLRDVLGAYRILNCIIEDNVNGGIIAERFRRFEEGGFAVRGTQFRRNGGAGAVTIRDVNSVLRDLVIDANYFDANEGAAISLLAALNAPSITNNLFVNADGGTRQKVGLQLHPAEPVLAPMIMMNTFRQIESPMVNAVRLDQTLVKDNRVFTASADTLNPRQFAANFFGGAGQVFPDAGWTKHPATSSADWVRAAPGIALTSAAARSLVYRTMPSQAAYVEASITASVSGDPSKSPMLGVALAIDTAAQTALIAGVNGANTAMGVSSKYALWSLVDGAPSLLWESAVPMTETHKVALARIAGSTITQLFIDGKLVKSMNVPGVPASPRYGVFSTGQVAGQDRYIRTLNSMPYVPDTAPTDGTILVRNIATNPSFEVSGGMAEVYGTGGAGTGSRPLDAAAAHGGSYRRLLTWSAATTDPVGAGARITAFEDVQLGKTYTYSVWVFSSRARKYRPLLSTYSGSAGGGSFVASKNGAYVDVPANTWTRLSIVSDPIPSGAVSVRLDVSAASLADGGTNFQVGDTLGVDDYMGTEGTTLHAFFDGDRNGGAWVGTANASASTKTITV